MLKRICKVDIALYMLLSVLASKSMGLAFWHSNAADSVLDKHIWTLSQRFTHSTAVLLPEQQVLAV